MSIKHTIRDGKGGLKEVRLTSLLAIRAFCRECVGWKSLEVEKCTSALCPLYPFRFGRNPSRKGVGGLKNLKNPNLSGKNIIKNQRSLKGQYKSMSYKKI